MNRLALVLPALLLVGCTRTPAGLSPAEARFTARWIEDVATGETRRPGELRLRPTSPEMSRVADWLAHEDGSGAWSPPPFLHNRSTRRAALDARLAKGELLIDASRALVGAAPDLKPEIILEIQPLIDAENRDRQLTDALVISRSRAIDDALDTYLATVRAERIGRDRSAGGRLGKLQRVEGSDN